MVMLHIVSIMDVTVHPDEREKKDPKKCVSRNDKSRVTIHTNNSFLTPLTHESQLKLEICVLQSLCGLLDR